MYLALCFLFCFFATVLGTYLGLELISVRRAERVARTILKAASPGPQPAPSGPTVEAAGSAATPNYFSTK